MIDTTGLLKKRFGKLEVLRYCRQDQHCHSIWECRCDCGGVVFVHRSSLTRGLTKSCGCSRGETRRKTHKVIEENEYKHCHVCKNWLPLAGFHKNSEAWDGLQKKCKACDKDLKNSDKFRATHRKYNQRKRKEDSGFRILLNLRDRVSKSLRGKNKSAPTLALLGCSIGFFKKRLEAKFDENMTWNNYGSLWHVDHIKPCAAFDLTDPEQQKACFHYSNLQPMLAKDNLYKNSLYNGVLYRKRLTCETIKT